MSCAEAAVYVGFQHARSRAIHRQFMVLYRYSCRKVAIKKIKGTFRDLTDAKRILRELKLLVQTRFVDGLTSSANCKLQLLPASVCWLLRTRARVFPRQTTTCRRGS